MAASQNYSSVGTEGSKQEININNGIMRVVTNKVETFLGEIKCVI